MIRIVQIPGGDVIGVQIGSPCNADPVTRNSIEQAVQARSPLPYKGFESVFSSAIQFEFQLRRMERIHSCSTAFSRNRSPRFALALFASFAGAQGALQERAFRPSTSSNGNASAMPIAVVPFAFEGAALPPETDVGDVVAQRSQPLAASSARCRKSDIVERPTRGGDIKFPTWRLLKQDYIVVGRAIDGRRRRRARRIRAVRRRASRSACSAWRSPASAPALRDVAHQIADLVYEKITGVRGAFWTRIAYVTATGVGNNISYALMVADSDGFNPQIVVRSREPLLSPAWSPDGRKLAYVSFERGNSSIYIQDIATGAREVVSSAKGINGAPAFSPDGRQLALTLSYGGNPDIYVMDLGSRVTRRRSPSTSRSTPRRPGRRTARASISPPTAPASRRSTRCRHRGGDADARHVPGPVQRAAPSISYDGKRSLWCRATETCIVLRF